MIPLIEHIVASLRGAYPEHELHELAYWIVEETTGLSRSDILCGCKGIENIPHLEIILQKLRQHEPIQYIFSHAQWMGLDLRVTPATLIPRPETAELVEWVLYMFPSTMEDTTGCTRRVRVLDIGTGSGCMALALQQHRPMWEVSGLDVSPEALQVARYNGAHNHIDVQWLQADILTEDIGTYDIIVSNPPYVRESEQTQMEDRVLCYEPHTALFVPDNDPLLFYRRIASQRRATHLFFEINEALPEEMCALLRGCGYVDVQLKHDMYGKPRMLYGRLDRKG